MRSTLSKRLRVVFPPAEEGVDTRVGRETTDGPHRDVDLPALEGGALLRRRGIPSSTVPRTG